MATLETLKKWFNRDLGRCADWGTNADLREDRDGRISLYLYTDVNRYIISAVGSPEDAGCPEEGKRSYLGCVMTSRKERAGENWTRGRDLSDGEFTEATWHRILGDIVSMELVRVHRPVEAGQVPKVPNVAAAIA